MRFLFVDRILERKPGQSICGVKHVTADDPYLIPDESGRMCFAPSLIGESLGQLAAWDVMAGNDFSLRPVAGVVASACMHRKVYPGETLLLESFIDNLDDRAVQYHSRASVLGETVFSVDGALGPLLPMAEFNCADEVRQQFAEINRPGSREDILSPTLLLNSEPLMGTRARTHLSFDGILQHKLGEAITAVKYINRFAPYFPDHFPRRPVLPLTILLECKLHLAGIFLKEASLPVSYKIHALRKIKMSEFVQPGDIVHTQAKLDSCDDEQLILKFRSEVNGKRICVLEMIFKGY